MAIILGSYLLLWAPSFFVPAYSDSAPGLIASIPFVVIYLFHGIGIPGLLQNDGACG